MNNKEGLLCSLVIFIFLIIGITGFMFLVPDDGPQWAACRKACLPHVGYRENNQCVCDLTKEVK